MKIIANNYRANEVIRMIRENSGKTQKEFGEVICCSILWIWWEKFWFWIVIKDLWKRKLKHNYWEQKVIC